MTFFPQAQNTQKFPFVGLGEPIGSPCCYPPLVSLLVIFDAKIVVCCGCKANFDDSSSGSDLASQTDKEFRTIYNLKVAKRGRCMQWALHDGAGCPR